MIRSLTGQVSGKDTNLCIEKVCQNRIKPCKKAKVSIKDLRSGGRAGGSPGTGL